MKTKLLLIPDKPDQERDAIASSWIRHNGEVLRISKFWEKPHIAKEQQVSIYGYDTFSLVLAQVLGLELIEPKDEFIGQLDERWVKRGIQILTLETIDQAHFPTFVKPVKPKTFQSAIYHDKKQFQNETKGIEKSEQLIVSDIIDITCEARAFILDNQLLDIAIYEGDSDLVLARTFLTDFLATYGKNYLILMW